MSPVFPDTALAREARKIIEAAEPVPIFNHSLRAFLLGRSYAKAKKIAFDEEALYLSALFHDLGLCEGHRAPARAFTFASSAAMRDHLVRHKVEPRRITAMTEAIEFHFQLLPNWSKGEVAGLMQVGAHMDVTGMRRWAIGREAKAEAASLPRAGFFMEFNRCMLRSTRSWAALMGLMLPERYR